MSDILAKGRDLYAALAADDVDAIQRLLSADFSAELSEGLPEGFGRRYDGLDTMMTEGWGALAQLFDIVPKPEELVDGGDVLIGRGTYVGHARSTGKPVRAAFAHFWRYDGERFTAVTQVTDSGRWRDALIAD